MGYIAGTRLCSKTNNDKKINKIRVKRGFDDPTHWEENLEDHIEQCEKGTKELIVRQVEKKNVLSLQVGEEDADMIAGWMLPQYHLPGTRKAWGS